MTDDHLEHARGELESALDAQTGPPKAEIADIATAVADLIEREAAADHAVFDGYLNRLRQARETADDQAAAHLESALEHAERYRADLESV